jgi:PAS domain S-box-containing protein
VTLPTDSRQDPADRDIADLESVVSTSELGRRSARPPDYVSENRALVALVGAMAASPEDILQSLAETALDLCRAGSAGISLLDEERQRFRWAAVAGQWASYLGTVTPRDAAPCGAVLNRNAALLFSRPERHFQDLAFARPHIEEGLWLPFDVGERAAGTIWVAAHDRGRTFDAEDVRVLANLARFAAAHAARARRPLAGADGSAALPSAESLREPASVSSLIVNSIPGLVATLTPAGEVEVVNNRVLSYCGRTLEELKGWGTSDTVHPEDRPGAVQVIAQSMASGDPYEIVERIRRFDGVYRWFQVRGLPLRDSSGRIVRWYVLLTDIDDLKRVEAAARSGERNLKRIIDTIPALAWSARPDGSADYFNQHYLDFVGLSAEQAGDSGWTAAVHPDDLPGLISDWLGIMASEAPGESQARLRRDDGEYRWFLFRTNPFRDESGTIVKWYGVNTDIEDRKQAEAELRRAYDSFAAAQRLSKTGNFTADIVADDHTWSEEMYRIFEHDPATKVTVQAVRDIIHPEDLPSFDAGFARSMEGADFDLVFRIATPSGRLKHVHAVARVIERVEGRPLFVGAIQDVTERRLAEETLNRTRSELAHVTRVTTLSTLTASIAHEVNQPLAGIITNASTCLRMLDAAPPNLDGARETARRTIRDGNRASEVIARLRALFGSKEFAPEAVDLNAATREVIALSSSELRRSGVTLRLDLADDLPSVDGDRVQLQQVILNLLLNASEAMRGVDERPRELVISTEPLEDDQVRLSVRDAGVGFDPHDAARLFDAFYTTKSGGMGIGLSVSRSIIESHRGRLWAEPNDRQGATFSFALPRVDPSAAGARDPAG